GALGARRRAGVCGWIAGVGAARRARAHQRPCHRGHAPRGRGLRGRAPRRSRARRAHPHARRRRAWLMNAGEWLAGGGADAPDIAVLGAPISKASISASEAWSTPPAFRYALARFPTWDAQHGIDVETLRAHDLGDIPGDRDEADASAAHARIEAAAAAAAGAAPLVFVIGGDNSLTRPAMRGVIAARP